MWNRKSLDPIVKIEMKKCLLECNFFPPGPCPTAFALNCLTLKSYVRYLVIADVIYNKSGCQVVYVLG